MRVWPPPSEKLALTVNLAQRPIVCHGRLNTLMDLSCLSEVFQRANNLFCSLKFQMVLRKDGPNFEFHFMTHENTFFVLQICVPRGNRVSFKGVLYFLSLCHHGLTYWFLFLLSKGIYFIYKKFNFQVTFVTINKLFLVNLVCFTFRL